MTPRGSAPFMFDRAAETMPRRDLATLQLARLKDTLARAYEHVAPIRRKFEAAAVTPAHLSCLADLARFPFTLKADLRDNYPFGLFAVPREQVIRLHGSSGTTGKPIVVGYTKGDLDLWSDLMARTLACTGARPGDIVHNAYGYGLFTGGLGFHYGAEPWSAPMRRDLQARLGITAVDVYGLSEIIGPGIASECDVAQNGLHGWEDHFLFEIIDPHTMAPLPVGETGELVITTLTKEALPMIRYRTHDITRLCDEPCPCGRTHLRIMRVTGRDDDMLIIRGVNVYPSQVEAVLVGFPGLAPYYQIVLGREGALDAMTVEVERTPDTPDDAAFSAAKSAEVQHRLKSLVGVTCRVVVKAPGEVPRSQGKAVRVRDERKAT